MAEQLKNLFFQKPFIESLIKEIQIEYPLMNVAFFRQKMEGDEFEKLELKQKMRYVTMALHDSLPDNYEKVLSVFLKVAPKFSGFDSMVFADFVECYGLENIELSLPALEVFTKCCSSEFAIRPFILRYPEKTIEQMKLWAEDKDERVRRLASEGCRSRLPWAMALPSMKSDPSTILPILEMLKDDPSEMVRKSVSNNLNDISKDNSDLVLELCEKWKGKSPEVDKLLKHACRTLLKAGNKKALAIFGFERSKAVKAYGLKLEPENVKIGDKVFLEFVLEVSDTLKQKVRLEYIIFYKKSSNIASKKVFQIKEAVFAKGKHKIKKSHAFIDQTTRKHYPGIHSIHIVVNGDVLLKKDFMLGL